MTTKKKKGLYIYQQTFCNGDWHYYNFPCIRSKSHFRLYLKEKDKVDYYKKDYKIKGISFKTVIQLDPYQDDKVGAWNERKSWKRNSRKRKQWQK